MAAIPQARRGRIQTFDTLYQYPNYRYLWMGNLSYNIGHWMQTLVFGWLAYELTNSPFLVAVLSAARSAPQLLGPFSGALADKLDRRRFLIFLQCFSVLAAIVTVILAETGKLQYWHLLLIAFSTGVVWTVADATRSALIVDIVGGSNIVNAIALNMMAVYATWVIGPLLGGTLIPLIGVGGCQAIAGGWYLLGALLIIPMSLPPRNTRSQRLPISRVVSDGFRYVFSNKSLLSILSISVATNLFVWPAYQSLMPVIAKDALKLDSAGLGLLMTSFGAGALIGASTIATLGRVRRKGLVFLIGTAFYGLFFGLFANSGEFLLAIIMVGLAGLFASVFANMQRSLSLTLAAEEMRGRVMGFVALAIGIIPFSSLGIGAASNVFGASTVVAVSCGLLILVVVIELIWLPRLRKLE